MKPVHPLSSPLTSQGPAAKPTNLGPSPALGKFGPGRPPEFGGTPILVQKDGGLRSTITAKK